MSLILNPIFELLMTVVYLYQWVLILAVIISWMINFEMLSTYNRSVMGIINAINGLTEPLVAPIRRYLPVVGGLDLSFIVLYLLTVFVRSFLQHLAFYIHTI